MGLRASKALKQKTRQEVRNRQGKRRALNTILRKKLTRNPMKERAAKKRGGKGTPGPKASGIYSTFGTDSRPVSEGIGEK